MPLFPGPKSTAESEAGRRALVIWGVNLGWGLKGVELITSRSIDTGESRVIRRNLQEGFILGLNGGLGVNF